LNIPLAAKEKLGLPFIKHFQPSIGAGVIGLALRTVWAGWLSFNRVDEHAKRLFIVKTFAKVDPGPLR
jgi:hypothetical protein